MPVHTCVAEVPEMQGWASFYEDVPVVGFMSLVFTRMSDEVTVGNSGMLCPLSVELY